MITLTVVPGATLAVPERVGVASLVWAFAPPEIVSAGDVVSIVMDCVETLSFRAGSLTEAVTGSVPSARLAARIF